MVQNGVNIWKKSIDIQVFPAETFQSGPALKHVKDLMNMFMKYG